MISISLGALLSRVSPLTGYPFPTGGKRGEGSKVANGFENAEGSGPQSQSAYSLPVVQITDELLGRYEFMPVVINDGLRDYQLPNAFVMITGEKAIIETDVIDRGTVFEKIYERPYDISIITTIQGDKGQWPAEKYLEISELYKGKRKGEEDKNAISRDLVTLKCALTAPFLVNEDNFLITKITVLDNEGAEDLEVIQIDGRSNIEFKLLID